MGLFSSHEKVSKSALSVMKDLDQKSLTSLGKCVCFILHVFGDFHNFYGRKATHDDIRKFFSEEIVPLYKKEHDQVC